MHDAPEITIIVVVRSKARVLYLGGGYGGRVWEGLGPSQYGCLGLCPR